MSASTQTAFATFGGGCFWCTEAIFQRMTGVKCVMSGYSGGKIPQPTYREVCSGRTGHAEVIRIEYDPHQVDFSSLLLVFFKTHDPTTLNRQGADVGTQYRSVVFYHDEAQKRATESIIQKLTEARVFARPIVTEISPASAFYPAEAEHQDYYRTHEYQPYCQVVIQPKLHKFLQQFPEFAM